MTKLHQYITAFLIVGFFLQVWLDYQVAKTLKKAKETLADIEQLKIEWHHKVSKLK